MQILHTLVWDASETLNEKSSSHSTVFCWTVFFCAEKIVYKYKIIIILVYPDKSRNPGASLFTFVSPFWSFFNPPLTSHSAVNWNKHKMLWQKTLTKIFTYLSAIVKTICTNNFQLHPEADFLLCEEVHGSRVIKQALSREYKQLNKELKRKK